MIMGVAGACRCNELTFLDISQVHVLNPNTKTNISRNFTIIEEAFSVNAVEICFVRKSFLGLPYPESLTGHGIRRSSSNIKEVEYGSGKLY